MRPKIVFENVSKSFRLYKKQSEKLIEIISYKKEKDSFFAVNDLSFDIHEGEPVGIVGLNGSGKSTFTKLLLGALIPGNGSIKVNEIELSKLLHCFRDKTSYVPQDYGMFKMTLSENLRLGNDRISLDGYDPKFINFLNKLPEGHDTPLGNVYPNGVDLSGGEWQRISIERALLRDHTETYIMDEPAASLDPIMESELYEHFTRELKGKTIIITSHRLGACSLADYIYVFDHGEIIEEGTHEFLMSIKGKYYEMYIAQRSLYERSAG